VGMNLGGMDVGGMGISMGIGIQGRGNSGTAVRSSARMAVGGRIKPQREKRWG
jgi:hypothetical protein